MAFLRICIILRIMFCRRTKLIFFAFGAILLWLPFFGRADVEGQQTTFFVESKYDASQREQITAVLRYVGPKLYFYTDKSWWDALSEESRLKANNAFTTLSAEFENKIYPTLTAVFGQEWRPGIDNDERITILLHPMLEGAGGYFSSGDEYDVLQYPRSNKREMVYLNSSLIDKADAKIFLAHEFTHLLEFNQKERLFGVQDEIWLNEARAEYSSTLAGYDAVYETSNLRRRISNFLENPNDSLTEWQGKSGDYGALTLFTHYLVDHYGIRALTDSLKMRKTGVDSLNEALKQAGSKENFSQVFTNWMIAIFLNDCSYGTKYCYLNPILQNFHIVPLTHFLPLVGESNLSMIYRTSAWAGNWYKIIGGREVLKLEFIDGGAPFKVSYIVEDFQSKFTINFLALDQSGKGTIYVPDFGTKNKALMILPSVQTSVEDQEGKAYQFAFSASTVSQTPDQEAILINQLLEQITALKAEISRIQLQILQRQNGLNCTSFQRDLSYGLSNSSEVKCLQEFLKSKGQGIYPEGIVSGNYFSLTVLAVKRYQASKGISQTGYFGPLTRGAANLDILK